MGYVQGEEIIFVNKHPYMHVGDGQYLPAIYGGAEEGVEQTEFEKVQGFIADQVKEEFTRLQQAERQQRQPISQSQQSDQDQARQQLKDAIRPLFEEDINSAKFTSSDAKDYVSFYRQNPQAGDFEEDIEKTFAEAAKQGRPLPRQDIYDWHVGRLHRTDSAKFTERMSARQKQQVADATTAADIGIASLNKAKDDPVWSKFDSLSVEEMEKALEGLTF